MNISINLLFQGDGSHHYYPARRIYRQHLTATPNKPMTLQLPQTAIRLPALNPSPTIVSETSIFFLSKNEIRSFLKIKLNTPLPLLNISLHC